MRLAAVGDLHCSRNSQGALAEAAAQALRAGEADALVLPGVAV